MKAEQVEGDAPQAQEETTKHGTTTCPLVDLYPYKEKDSKVMSDSEDAKALGLTSLSTLDIMLLKSQMEALVWQRFRDQVQKSGVGSWLFVTINATQLKFKYICFY